MSKRVAIVLTGLGWDAAPFADPSVDIWTMNDAYRLNMPRISRLYELHHPDDWWLSDDANSPAPSGKYHRLSSHPSRLNELGVPLVMQAADDRWPHAVPYPLAAVIDVCGHRPLFDSSAAYMIGHAMLEGVGWLGLYGANMAGPEYAHQRPNVQWLLGLAVGRGMRVAIAQPSTVLASTHLYAYEPPPCDGASIGTQAEMMSALNMREAVVQRWIDGETPTDHERAAVRKLDDTIGRFHTTLLEHALEASGMAAS